MKRTVSILLLAFSVFPFLFAQGGKEKAAGKDVREVYPDSLWNVLHTSELTSEERVGIYRLLSNWYGSYDTHRTIACLKKGLEIAERDDKVHSAFYPHARSLLQYADAV